MSGPHPGNVDRAAFRRAVGQFASGIVVVTTSAGHAMTVSAFTSVSLEPPLVLFCAEKIARFHDAVLEAGAWAVSVLAEDAEKTARWLATRGRPLAGQLDGVPHHAGRATGAALLDGALAALECQTFAVYDGGDHSIIVGRVVAVGSPADPQPGVVDPQPRGPQPGVVDPQPRGPQPGVVDPQPRGPLVHYAGRYRPLRPAEH